MDIEKMSQRRQDTAEEFKTLMGAFIQRDTWPTCAEILSQFKIMSNNYFMDSAYSSDEYLIRSTDNFEKRHLMQENWSYAIPCKEALDKITSYSPIIEIGAGKGFWAYLLKKNGCDIIASDIKDSNWYKEGHFIDIEDLDCIGAIDKYPDRTFLTCWPPYGFYMTAKNLSRIKTLIFIGEEDGCTGCSRFENNIARVFKQIDEIEIPQWWCIHDKLRIFSRRAR